MNNWWLGSNIYHKIIAILIVCVFLVVTFACFTMATNHGHSLGFGAACETVMTLTDNIMIQTGMALLLVAVAAYFYSRASDPFLIQSPLHKLHVFLSFPPDYLVSSQEHSYLRELFSAGIIHTKLHSITL